MTQRKRVKLLAFFMGTTALASAAAFAAPPPETPDGSGPHTEESRALSAFSTARNNLRKAVEMAEGKNRAPAAAALLGFYMERGLYPEALTDMRTLLGKDSPALKEAELRDRAAAIRIMATFGREGGDHDFSDRETALFWQLAAAALRGDPIPRSEEEAAAAKRALPLLFRQPAALQRDLALPLTDALLSGGNAGAVRAFADDLAAEAPGLLGTSCKQWLSARLAEFEGFPEAAKARYATMGPPEDRCGAHAKLRLALLQLADNRFDPERLKSDMKALTASWYGDNIEEGALRILVLLERDESDPLHALSWLRLLADRFPAAMDEEHVAGTAAKLAAALFSQPPSTDLLEHRKRRRAYLAFLKDDTIRRQEDERFAALLLSEGRHKEAAGLFAKLLKDLPGEANGNAAERRHLTVLKAKAELRGGAADNALASLAALPDFDTLESWTGDETGIYLDALIAAGRLDEANIKLGHLLDTRQTQQLAEAYIAAEDWEQAYHLMKRPLGEENEETLSPAYYDLFVSAALLSANEAEAARLLRNEDMDWKDGSALARMAILTAPAPRTLSPDEKVDALLQETEELVSLAKAL